MGGMNLGSLISEFDLFCLDINAEMWQRHFEIFSGYDLKKRLYDEGNCSEEDFSFEQNKLNVLERFLKKKFRSLQPLKKDEFLKNGVMDGNCDLTDKGIQFYKEFIYEKNGIEFEKKYLCEGDFDELKKKGYFDEFGLTLLGYRKLMS